MNLSPLAVQKFFDNNGRPLDGGLLFTYAAGTATPIATYTDASGGTPNTNPIVLNFRGEADVWLNSTLAYKFVLAPADDTDPPTRPIWSVDDITSGITLADLTQQIIGQILWPQTPEEQVAGVVPTNFAYQPGDVRRYGADDTAATDSTAAFNTALSANRESFAYGDYRLDGSVTIQSNKSLSGYNATATRGGAATTPMFYVLGVSSSLSGFYIVDANAAPNGVVVLGNISPTHNLNSWYWRFLDCTISGRVNQAGDILVYVPSGQVTFPLNANYFGTIQNINLYGGDIQLFLDNMANAHNLSNLQFWNGRTAGLRLRGAYANNANNMFFHLSAANGYIAVDMLNMSAGTTESSYNTISGFTAETGGALDKALNIGTNCEFNNIIGNSNVSGGYTISNPRNLVAFFGALANVGGGFFSRALVTTALFPTYSASITWDAAAGNSFSILANDGTAFTINAPTNPQDGQQMLVSVYNISGGVLGVITWNAVFKMAAWTNPANGFNRTVLFEYSSLGVAWHEKSRTPADVPN